MLDSLEFTPTRSEGLRRLENFLPTAGKLYADQRNHDFGPQDRSNVSTLSPYIRHRLITEREVLSAVLARHPYAVCDKFVQEVYWRTYWKGWLETRPGVWKRTWQRVVQQMDGLDRAGLSASYRAATEGSTGIDGFDQWARELIETGYMHNHARMWFASIWIFTLRLPWELGADFFMRNLLDGDPASNTLSWRWVAGLHTKGKHYVAARDNISRHTNGKYFPKNLTKTPEPLEEPSIDAPRAIAAADAVPTGRFALLLMDDDLGAASLGLDAAQVSGVAALSSAMQRSPNGISAHVNRFVAGALADALARAKTDFAASDVLATPWNAPSVDAIAAWVTAAGSNALVTPWAPVGPSADAIESLRAPLAELGIALHRIRRSFDQTAWPHCNRGFFQLKEKLPELLLQEGIVDAVPEGPSKESKPLIRRVH